MESDASPAVHPPTLPPRQSSRSSSPSPSPSPIADEPPSYGSNVGTHLQAAPHGGEESWAARDPRSSSTQSLIPSEIGEDDKRRKLLLVYLHGFMGDETSFRSFPAHVHRLLTVLLAETHIVHTKIYPRYRSRRKIGVARDNFSTWLAPHEASATDVILLGHSMGGLLSAEVALMPAPFPSALPTSEVNSGPLKHRILGTINFDVPFLGMHPGVVKSGLASIFRSPAYEDRWSPEVEATTLTDTSSISLVSSLGSGRVDTLWQPPAPDPNFNQRFANDVVLPVRKGWRNALHFVQKHSKSLNELGKATQQLVTSHLEFGGAMANYTELKTRYARIRALEDDNEDVRRSGVQLGPPPPRVRFVNYYTVSTGLVKKKVPSPTYFSPSQNQSTASLQQSLSPDDARGRTNDHNAQTDSARSQSPRISLEEHSDEGILRKDPEIPSSRDEDWDEAAESLTVGAPSATSISGHETVPPINTTSSLQALSEPPPKPLGVEDSPSPDTASVKASRDREKALRDPGKLKEKPGRKAEPANSNPSYERREVNSADSITSQIPSTSTARSTATPSRSTSPVHTQERQTPKREHTFCTLPPKDSQGKRDSTWVSVFMENVDEVGAHCGLFFVDERYERLVGDVADRVERWIHEDADRRFLVNHGVTDLG